MKGYVQVYTGNGKGKTTAALGLSIRAAGAGLRVYIAQFIKMGAYSEIKALERFSDLITVEQFGTGRFIKGTPTQKDIDAARDGLKKVKVAMSSGKYDIIIIEEGNIAANMGLFNTDALLDIIDEKPDEVELVITGRNADPAVMEKADLVTEMQEVKHYFQNGVQARDGIEK